MSGIFGYVGKRRALPTVLQGMKLFKDYNYDSCGLFLKGERGFFIKKILGVVEDLEKEVIAYNGDQTVGVVHLRWATHGKVEIKNTHPLINCDGKLVLMHKGIIENYRQLKRDLIVEGHVFNSDTDSEVLVHIIEKNYQGDLIQALRKTLNQITGTYALVVGYADGKNELVVANKGMGMVIGVGEGEYWITDDKSILRPFTDRIVVINDEEVMHVSENGFVSSTVRGGEINVVSKTIEVIDYGKHEDVQVERIEAEIWEHPEMVENTLAGRIDHQQLTAHFGGLFVDRDNLRKVNLLTFVGSGGSYFTAMMAKKFIEDYVAINVNSYTGLEMRNKKYLMTTENSALFAISQSGSTEDTIAAVREAKQLGLNVYGITNTVGSQLAKETPSGIYLHAGPVMTGTSMRSFMSQLIIIILLTLFFGRLKGLSPTTGKEIIKSLEGLPIKMKSILNNAYLIEAIVKKYRYENDFVVVGFKYCQVVAQECVLRMQDMTGVEVVSYDLDFLKYGGIRHMHKQHIILYLLPLDSVYDDNLKMLRELKKKNSKVIVFTQEGAIDLEGLADDVIILPKVKEIVMPLTMLMALQMFAMYLRKEKTNSPKKVNIESIDSDFSENDFNTASDFTPLY
jgi:glucosamine--fructose-6-phosphate aminotransferase (isomerizing)